MPRLQTTRSEDEDTVNIGNEKCKVVYRVENHSFMKRKIPTYSTWEMQMQ
jgi:hypothetical protein